MKSHYSDVQMWFSKSKHTDSFAKHFVRHFISQPKAGQIREVCNLKILYTFNPFSFTRGARTFECRLCMGEKMEILDARKKNAKCLINKNSDIYGPCRHRTKFHRFPCTDELCESKKNSSSASLPLRQSLLCLNKRARQQYLNYAG